MSVAAAFAIPGALETPTGGYRYDREVLARLAGHGVACRHLPLGDSFPFPNAGDLDGAVQAFAALDPSIVTVVDGLALGAMPAEVIGALRGPLVALVHHPLALETGLNPETAARLAASERVALTHAKAVIVTSRMTARTLSTDYSVPASCITVAEPGTERAARAAGSGNAEKTILAVGAVSPRKGYDLLMEALGRLRALDWTLVIAGAADRDPAAAEALRRAIGRNGLGARVTLAGSLSQAGLARLYGLADLFVMASLYEGYGMALAEAMAHGLPIVTTTGGAAAETVPDGAALKVPPGDVPALTAALGRALGDDDLRASLGEAAWQAGQSLPTWDDAARIVAGVIKEAAR